MTRMKHNSKNNEYNTPSWLIECARKIMGSIDVDPASNDVAQEFVQARRYYTKGTNGLIREWKGNVWLNPPYERGVIDKFVNKTLLEYYEGNAKQIIVLVNIGTETKWVQKLLQGCDAVCFLNKRIKFYTSEGQKKSNNPQGSMVLYFGGKVDIFKDVMSNHGTVFLAEHTRLFS